MDILLLTPNCFRSSVLVVSKSPPIQCFFCLNGYCHMSKIAQSCQVFLFLGVPTTIKYEKAPFGEAKQAQGGSDSTIETKFVGSYKSVQTISLRMGLPSSKVSVEKQFQYSSVYVGISTRVLLRYKLYWLSQFPIFPQCSSDSFCVCGCRLWPIWPVLSSFSPSVSSMLELSN